MDDQQRRLIPERIAVRLSFVLFGVPALLLWLATTHLLWPVLFSIPWARRRSRNTSVGIVIHAGVNGPGFLAVALGLLPA